MWLAESDEGLLLECKVIPNASKTAIEGLRDDRLLVRLATPPVDGKANRALIKFMSKELGISKSKIEIIQGEKSRSKRLRLRGIALDQAQQILSR